MNEGNKAIVRRLFDECLNQRRPELYPELFSDVVYRTPLFGELHKEEHRQFLLSFIAGFPDARWTIEDQFAEEGRVVTRWTFTGTHNGTFMGIDATGKQLRTPGISIHRIAGGKIVEEWAEWDTLAVMQQWGLLPIETSIGRWFAPTESPVLAEWDSSAKV